MPVNLTDPQYNDLLKKRNIAEWLKREYPMIYQLAEISLANEREAKERGIQERKS